MAVTWSPTDFGTGVIVSADRRVVTLPDQTGIFNARATLGYTSGKKYIEFALANFTLGTASDFAAGIGNVNTPLTQAADWPLGNIDLNSCAALATFGCVLEVNNADTAGFGGGPGEYNGSVIGLACDFDNHKVWATGTNMRAQGGGIIWNDDVLANQDPANNIGGADISVLHPGPYFPMCGGFPGVQVTLIGSGAFSLGSLFPVGYTAWDAPPFNPQPFLAPRLAR